MWSRTASCQLTSTTGSPTQTAVFNLTNTSHLYELQPNVTSGVWILCFKISAGGIWTHVSFKDLLIIVPPSFSPTVGIAGHPTKVAFTTGSTGDIVLFLPTSSNCSVWSGPVCLFSMPHACSFSFDDVLHSPTLFCPSSNRQVWSVDPNVFFLLGALANHKL